MSQNKAMISAHGGVLGKVHNYRKMSEMLVFLAIIK